MLLAIPFGLGIGLTLGMLGGGGSVLAVPVLVYVLGEDVQSATTASLAIVAVAALAGGLGHARDEHVCWRHAGAFTLVAVPGIVAGTAAGDAVDGSALLVGFALVMLVAAWVTWRKASGSSNGEHVGHHTICPPLRLGRDVPAGLGVGLLTGFFGVGGGFIVVPALAMAIGLSIRDAVGTSLVIIGATSIIGFGVHLLAGRTVDVAVTSSMTTACVAGVLAGAALSPRVAQATLGRAFVVLVAAVAAYLIVASSFLGGPPAS